MATHVLPSLAKYIPLWLRSVPKYPLYCKGNPQLRIYLPLFWMKLIKWSKALPNDTVCFQVHHQMTEYDVKNYLEKIYKVNVLTVRTILQKGEERQHPRFGYSIQPGPDKRLAFVQLKSEIDFKFPDIFEEKENSDKKSQNKDDGADKLEDTKDATGRDIPTWFK